MRRHIEMAHKGKTWPLSKHTPDIEPEELEGIMQGLCEVAEGKIKSFDEIESELATKYNRVN